MGGARQDKWAPSASQELSRRFFERLWRARKRFPSPFGRPGASQERSWSALGALLASEASYQKPSKGDCGRLDRQRTIKILATIFGRFSMMFNRFSGDLGTVRGLVRNVAVWTLSVGCCLSEQAAIDADPRRRKFILNERPRSSSSALSCTVLLLLQTTAT